VGTVSIVVVSFNARGYLERCLAALADAEHEVIVVDSASTDGSQALVRDRFREVRLIELEANRGYGAAANEGMRVAGGDYLLVINCDGWPLGDGVERLVKFMEANPSVGVAGPRLLNPDGSLQPSVRGCPTLWRLATEYFFLRWLNPRSSMLNAFYGANFDHRTRRSAEFLVGAALLLRREALAEVGAFDTSFYMFNEEVDLCYRMAQAGWQVEFFPDAQFVHVGGASTGLDWDRMYREQLRSHLRFLAKHRGAEVSERGRKQLLWAMRLRSLVFLGERARIARESARWLSSTDAEALIGLSTGRQPPAPG
jgi:N-acetylglucosaminyl-diphospho-decaprenol L-rhamnosyltransferase